MISRGSILIVDDGVDSRKSLGMILKPLFKVYTVENGQEAINFLSQKKVDLVTSLVEIAGLAKQDKETGLPWLHRR